MRDKNLSSFAGLTGAWAEAKAFWKSMPQRARFIDKSVNSSGNFIKGSKNCVSCWNAEKSEDSKYLFLVLELKDSYDTTSVWHGEGLYELIAGWERLSNVRFSYGAVKGTRNIEYCDMLSNVHDSFGCVNLSNKSFCILNRQYTKEEYQELLPRIKAHMNEMPYKDLRGREFRYGEFFPPALSPFGYNETIAFEYFPLDRDQALAQGFKWNDYASSHDIAPSDYEIPDDIKNVDDNITEKILRSTKNGKVFRIIPMELAFCRRFGIPIPREAPFERHRRRVAFLSDHFRILDRECGKCRIKVQSVYSKEEFPTVYCEACYNAEVV